MSFTDMQIIRTAKICHEANRAYCESIGDNTQVPWDKAESWQKASAVNGVKYRVSSDTNDMPRPTPKQMHQNWMKEKELDGWVFGLMKDTVAKTHPCMLPYEDLPEGQRKKDQLFSAVVDALL